MTPGPFPQDSPERFRQGLGPVMRRRAQAVIDHPTEWRLSVGALIWQNRAGERVTDQAVEALREGS